MFVIDTVNGSNINKVRITGPADLEWVDTKIDDELFKREIGKNTLYIKNGSPIVKEKVLPAKPFSHVKTDAKIDSIEKFMTIDIETLRTGKDTHFGYKEGVLIPYLICGYYIEKNKPKNIFRFNHEIDIESINKMMTDFITQLIGLKHIKYVYAHNFSGFDGIFLLKHLINYSTETNTNSKVEPLLFNDKLIGVKFTISEEVNGKITKRVIIFKDSFLLLPLSLRKLCTAFNVVVPKTIFSYVFTRYYI